MVVSIERQTTHGTRHPSGRKGEILKRRIAAKKAQGIQLGKPKGTLQDSKFDQDRKRIVELLSLGVSIRKIALEHLKYGDPSSLYYFVQTRELIPEAEQLKANRD